MSTVKQCPTCEEKIKWDDDVVLVGDGHKVYHVDCVSLVPNGYIAFLDGEYLGRTQNGDGGMAAIHLDEEEYIDLEEENDR